MRVITKKALAIDSLDYESPGGSIWDIHPGKSYCLKIKKLINSGKYLDLGAGGGVLVDNLAKYGVDAYGLEGTDHAVNTSKYENLPNHPWIRKDEKRWKIITDAWKKWYNKRLFHGDVTEEFSFYNDNSRVTFDIISAWEVLEHIHENKIPFLVENIRLNLNKGGIFIGSVSTQTVDPHHVCCYEKPWWDNAFSKGFEIEEWPVGLSSYRDEPNSFLVCYRRI